MPSVKDDEEYNVEGEECIYEDGDLFDEEYLSEEEEEDMSDEEYLFEEDGDWFDDEEYTEEDNMSDVEYYVEEHDYECREE